MNKGLMNFTAAIAKIGEILIWIIDALITIAMVIFAIFHNSAIDFMREAIEKGSLTITGLNIPSFTANSGRYVTIMLIALLCGIVVLAFAALICRNINRVFKSETPFCKENVIRVKRIGYFTIGIPIIGIVLDLLIFVITGVSVDLDISLTTIFFGLVVLCLSQFFAYGASLEDDVDGLV